MKPARSHPHLMPWAGLSLLLAGLIATLPATGAAQDAAPDAEPATPTTGETEGEEADEEGEGEGEEVDPRIKAAEEEARRLRIERQTEFTSTLPTEGGFFASAAVPEALIGERGLRAGKFLILPALSFGASYTDNAGSDEEARDEEVSVGAVGVVRAQTLLARHQFGFDASAISSHSFQESNDDYFDWQVGGDARLDLTRRSSLSGRVDYSLDTEDDSSAEAEGQANDVETINSSVSYNIRGNRLDYVIDLGLDRSEFSGAGSADRDRTTYQVSQQVTHQTTERLSLFLSPQYSYSTFDQDVADDGEGRDTQSITGLVGADFSFRAPVTLSGAAGYSRLFFEDSGRDDTDSLVANAAVDWQLNPLSSVGLAASHSLSLTTVDDSAARTDSTLELSGSRRVGIATALQGTLTGTYTDFTDIDRGDYSMSAGLGLSHRLSDRWFLGLAYRYQQRFSDEDGADFYENQVATTLSVVY